VACLQGLVHSHLVEVDQATATIPITDLHWPRAAQSWALIPICFQEFYI
jgi:hypothetical protein